MPLPDPLKEMLRYWRALPRKHGARIPRRLAFHPGAVHKILPRVSLLKRVGDDQLLVGQVGTGVEELWQQPVTGFNAYDLAAPSTRDNLSRFAHAILDQPSGAHIKEHAFDTRGRHVTLNSLYLPMADRNGITNYILGCTLTEGAEGTDLRSFIKDRLTMSSDKIKSMEFIDVGCGRPEIEILSDRSPVSTPVHSPRGGWWTRLIPSKPRKSGTKYDA